MVSPTDPAGSTGGRRSATAPHSVAAGVPLVATKLRAPASLAGYRGRSRVSALLDHTLTDATCLTILSAPSGYGKTVACAGWLESRAVAHALLSLDPADNDLNRFLRYLIASVRAVRPLAGSAMDDLFGVGTNASPDLVGATLLEARSRATTPSCSSSRTTR